MQGIKYWLLVMCIIDQLNGIAQLRWNGLGGDGQWANPNNWAGNKVPATSDDVLLDNTFLPGSYTVHLPPGDATVTIRSLTIGPAGSHTIEVILPAANTATPGFVANSPGTALTIQRNGIFRNASGASSGDPLQLAGALWIGNAGRYIHNTPRSHVQLVTNLSKAPGTETGIFEFDIKGPGVLISFAGKTFGTLILSAIAAGGARTYNARGASPVRIRGDLVIQDGVNFNLDLDDTIVVQGNYEQRGGLFNLGSGPNNTVLQIAGHLTQTKGTITERDLGLPVIELNGTNSQHLTVANGIQNSIALTINNPAGIVLQTPLVLPHHLQLSQGAVTTSPASLLTLQATCTVATDTLIGNSFINGPLKKEGLTATGQFLFPVGKGNQLRWLSLTNVTGNYQVEFFRANPRLMSNTNDVSIHHISTIEHWIIQADPAPTAQAQVKLSFNDPNSGGVTDLSALLVAQLAGGIWVNRGNTRYSGTAGSNGHVTSHPLTTFGPAAQYFTLASTTASFNPLLLNQPAAIVPGPAAFLTASLTPTVASQYTRLTLMSNKKTSLQLIITNTSGQTVKVINTHLQKGPNTIPIPVSLLRAGMYTLTAHTRQSSMPPVRFIKL
jgi:hypothetical protein